MEPAFELPILTCAQVRELDRVAMDEFGLPGVVLMENAGRALAQAIGVHAPAARKVAILCGRGNNGGDGYVVARYLLDRGVQVTLLETSGQSALSADAAVFQKVCVKLGMARLDAESPAAMAHHLGQLAPQDVVVDALLGTGFTGTLRDPAGQVLGVFNRAAKQWGSLRVAVDVPSGLNADTGEADEFCFRADLTLSLAAGKLAFGVATGRAVCGTVEVLHIGIPSAVYGAVSPGV